MSEILFSDIVWPILDRLKPFPDGVSIQNLEIKRIIKVTPFIRNAKEILNNDKFEVLKVIRYLQHFS